jgi:hypothetical protein
MFDSNIGPEGFYCGYNHDGTKMQGWPVNVIGSSFTINPFIADLNLDGITDISGGGYDQNLDRTYIYLWNANSYFNPDKNYLTMLQYNTRHNGVYGDYLMVGQEERAFKDSDFNVYPNPVAGFLQVEIQGFIDETELYATISDLNGKLIRDFRLSCNKGLNLRGIAPGIYLLSLRTEKNYLTTKKIIVSRH